MLYLQIYFQHPPGEAEENHKNRIVSNAGKVQTKYILIRVLVLQQEVSANCKDDSCGLFLELDSRQKQPKCYIEANF